MAIHSRGLQPTLVKASLSNSPFLYCCQWKKDSPSLNSKTKQRAGYVNFGSEQSALESP